MISVSITAYQETDKLKECLKSVEDFADEIIVIDLSPDQQIEEICKQYNVKIFKHRLVPFVELVRNFAISKTSGDWIFILDPDEILENPLKDELKKISEEGKFKAVNIPRKNIFFGRFIRHTNWWPDRHIRFFKKGAVYWSEKIHSYPKVSGDVLELPAKEEFAIKHFGYDSLKQFVDRQNRYSEIEAEQRYKMGERFSWVNFFWYPSREFLVRFLKHAGFLDGLYGFILTFSMMVYQLQVLIKLWETQRQR